MEVDGRKARVLECLDISVLLRDPDTVRSDLDLREAELLRTADQLREVVPHRWLAPRELHRRRRHRPLRPEHAHHVDHLVEGRLIDKAACPCVREAEVAVQVAPVGQVNVREQRGRPVLGAEPALKRAVPLGHLALGVFHSVPRVVVTLEPFVHAHVGPVEGTDWTVLRALPFNPDLPVLVANPSIQDTPARRAEALCRLVHHQHPPARWSPAHPSNTSADSADWVRQRRFLVVSLTIH